MNGSLVLVQRKCACGARSAGNEHECPKCARKRLQRKREHGSDHAGMEAPSISGGGMPLPLALRAPLERRFGHDFSQVRVHSGPEASEAALAVNAQAYTIGQDIVFGSGQFTPSTRQGLHLLAHELAHTVQQRGLGAGTPGLMQEFDAVDSPMEREAEAAAGALVDGRQPHVRLRAAATGLARKPLPGGDLECGALAMSSGPLPAAAWKRCGGNRNPALRNEDVLRLDSTGEPCDLNRLLNWAVHQDQSQAGVLAQIRNGSTFAGSTAVRNAAADIVAGIFQDMPLEQLRALHAQAVSERLEAERMQRALAEKRQREADWLGGKGNVTDRVLERPGKMTRPSATAFNYSTYDDQGAVVERQYPDVDALVREMRKQLETISKALPGRINDFCERLKLDRQVVQQVMDEAWTIQKPGLWLAGMGFSKEAIAHGVQGLKYFALAAEEAKKAIPEIAADIVTPLQVATAGRGLNEARYLTLQARHATNKMLGTKERQDLEGLNRLENVSRAGDIAVNFLAPGLGFGLATGKNFAVRMANMHSTGADFGLGAFVEETAVGYFSMKAGSKMAGDAPGFARSVASNLVPGQAAKAWLARDPSKFFEVDPVDAAFAFGAPTYHALKSRQPHSGPFTPERQGPQPMTELPSKPAVQKPVAEAPAHSETPTAAAPVVEAPAPKGKVDGRKAKRQARRAAKARKKLSSQSVEAITKSAKANDIPPPELIGQVENLRGQARDAANVMDPVYAGDDAHMRADGHDFDRNETERTWCRRSTKKCGLRAGNELDEVVDDARAEAREEKEAARALEERRAAKRADIIAANEKLTPEERAKQNEAKKIAARKEEPPLDPKVAKARLKEQQARQKEQLQESIENQRDLRLQMRSEIEQIDVLLRKPMADAERTAREAQKAELARQINKSAELTERYVIALSEVEITPYDRARAYSYSEAAAKEVVSRARGMDEMSKKPIADPSVDHVVPVKRLVEMDGWNELRPEEQRRILSDPENLRLMEKNPNSSKGDKRWKDWPEGKRIYGETVWNEMVALEVNLAKDLQNKIIDTLADRGKRPQRPDRKK